MMHTTRRTTAMFGALALGMGAALLVGAPAHAHNFVVSTTPAEGETLTELPTEFVITTNDTLLEAAAGGEGFAMQVTDAEGLYFGDGCVTVAGAGMSTAAALGAAGEYVLTWQAVSADAHPISGTIPFTWAPEPDAEVSEGSATAPRCGEATETEAPAEEAPAETQEPDADADTDPSAEVDDEASGDLLWISAIAVLVVAAVVTAIVLMRKRTTNAG